MKNVKDEVFAALQAVCDNVSDVYPTSWVDLPAIQYTEEENRVYERTANKEDKASVRYRIDIWNSGSTSGMAQAVDAAIAALGLVCLAVYMAVDSGDFTGVILLALIFGVPATGALIGWLLT